MQLADRLFATLHAHTVLGSGDLGAPRFWGPCSVDHPEPAHRRACSKEGIKREPWYKIYIIVLHMHTLTD
jgi:hypothetical protein